MTNDECLKVVLFVRDLLWHLGKESLEDRKRSSFNREVCMSVCIFFPFCRSCTLTSTPPTKDRKNTPHSSLLPSLRHAVLENTSEEYFPQREWSKIDARPTICGLCRVCVRCLQIRNNTDLVIVKSGRDTVRSFVSRKLQAHHILPALALSNASCPLVPQNLSSISFTRQTSQDGHIRNRTPALSCS